MSSLESALKVLSLLNKHHPVLRVGEVARRLDLPKSSVSRLLKTLSDLEVVEKEPDNAGYVAGRLGLVLSQLYLARYKLLDLVSTTVDTLTSEFQFACYSAVLSGPSIIIVKIKHGTYPLRNIQEIGRPLPAFDTSVGRALLARKTDAEVLELVRQSKGSSVAEDQILDVIEQVRHTGVALTSSTITPGVAAIGVAVADPEQNEWIGFSISYPTAAVNENLHASMLKRIREEAQAIGSGIGDTFWIGRDTKA